MVEHCAIDICHTPWNRVGILVNTFKHCAVVFGTRIIFKAGHEVARVFQSPC